MRYLNALVEKNPDATDVCDDEYWNQRRLNEVEKSRPLNQTNQLSTDCRRTGMIL
jgi:hypothetical protein